MSHSSSIIADALASAAAFSASSSKRPIRRDPRDVIRRHLLHGEIDKVDDFLKTIPHADEYMK